MIDQATAAILSDRIYQTLEVNDAFGPSNRYTVLKVTEEGLGSGYYGAIVYDSQTSTNYLVNRGTQPTSTADLTADVDLSFGGLAGDQFDDAQAFLNAYNTQPDSISVTAAVGHSLGGFLSQALGIVHDLDVVTFGSPGGQPMIQTLVDRGYSAQVTNYDASKVTNYVAKYDTVGEFLDHITGSNVITVNTEYLVGQTIDGQIATVYVKMGELIGYSNIVDVLSDVQSGDGNGLGVFYGLTGEVAGIYYHNMDNYRTVVAGDYIQTDSLPSLLGFASTDNGDTITFYKDVTVLDSEVGPDTVFYQRNDGELYGLASNSDGSNVFYYKDQNGSVVVKAFNGLDDMSSLTVQEQYLVQEIVYRKYVAERDAGREYYENNPDIVNDPAFAALPQVTQDQILELHQTGQAVSDEETQSEGIIDGGFSYDNLIGGTGSDGLGIGAENFNIDTLVHIIQTGEKNHQIDAALQLYNKIKADGILDSATGSYQLGSASVDFYANAHGGQVAQISYAGLTQSYITQYSAGDFQQRVVETIGDDGRTNTARVTLGDGLVNQLYNGEEITISYPDNYDYGAVGGIVGDLIGQQLENGELAHDIVTSAITRTLGSNIGEVLDFIADGNDLSDAIFDPFFGVNGTNQIRPDILDDFLFNLQSGVASAVSGAIVDELGDVIDIGGVGGEVFDVVANTVTTGVVNETFGFLFNGLDGGVYTELLSNGFDFSQPYPPNTQGITGTVGDYVQLQVVNALGAFAGNRLAGEVIEPESETAAIFGAAGSAFATAVASGTIAAGTTLQTALTLGFAGGPIGIAIGAFVGTVAGTLLGNAFAGEDEPWAGAYGGYNPETQRFQVSSWGSDDGGDASIARSMLQQVVDGVNTIIDLTQGKLRSGAHAPRIEIGYDGDDYFVIVNGQQQVFGTAVDAVYHASYKIMSGFDLVGGHAVLMRAWHNSDANNLFELKEDLEVAEAFQSYLANPTAILALMMNEPESDLAQSWAAILQRATELELHLPHEKDLDGGWNEVLLAQGVDSSLIPAIEGDSIILTDPVTGNETVVHHVIGPGYEIVRVEGTDSNDIIEVIVDGPSISYVDAGAGNDVVEGSEQADILVGGAGDDTINGNGGNDWIHGGTGDDDLNGGAGDDLIVGGLQNDYLIGGDNNDHIYGNDGDDILMGLDGQDFVHGGNGNDILYGDDTNDFDYLYGEEGDDTFYLNKKDYAYGGKGNDVFTFSDVSTGSVVRIGRGEGHDIINGKSSGNAIWFDQSIGANELFYERFGDNLKITVLGENQSVTVTDYFANSSGISIKIPDSWYVVENLGNQRSGVNNLVSNTASIAAHIEGEYGSISNDYLSQVGYIFAENYRHTDPSHLASTIVHGTQGDDTIYINSLSHYAFGGSGNDFIYTNTPTDNRGLRLYGDSGNDEVYGANGNDLLVGGLGNDIVRGNNGNDDLFGGHGDDSVLGGNGNDEIYGGAGDDELYGQGNDDELYGGDGDDYLEDSNGNNFLMGGAGNDILTVSLGAGKNKLYGELGNDHITGGMGDDLLFGGAGDDILQSGASNDWLSGGIGHDTLDAGDGDDIAYGDSGNDIISGGSGNDTLYGGEGDDDLSGNDGDDLFYGNDGADDIWGNNGQDTLFGGEGDDLLDGGDDNDIINGDDGVDILYGRLGNDVLDGGEGDDVLDGGEGDDLLRISSGNDQVRGGAGFDIASFTGAYSSYVLNVLSDHIAVSSLSNGSVQIIYDDIEQLEFSDGLYENGQFDVYQTPDAKDDMFDGYSGTPISGNVLVDNGFGADTDRNGGALSVEAQTLITATGASVDLSSNGDFIYTPLDGFMGVDSFSYNLLEVDNGSSIATVNLSITAAERPDVPTTNQVFLLEPVSVNTLSNSSSINTATKFTEKTISVSFETDSDVTSRQVIYEQGGNSRGLNIYIENGMLYQSVWNYGNGGNWGYKSIGVEIANNTEYTTTMLFEASSNTAGTLTGYINGSEFDYTDGLGNLYAHGDNIGIGWMKNASRFDGNNASGDGYTFNGNIHAIGYYNDILTGNVLADLQGYMGYPWIIQNTDLSGSATADVLHGTIGDNIISGGDGNDVIRAGDGNDIIKGGQGVDILYGGNGADQFVFEGGLINEVTTVEDYNTLEGDAINISDVLIGYDPLLSSILDFVQITSDGTDSVLSLDIDGGADNFVQIATISNVTGLEDEQQLLDNGNLIV